MKQSEFSRNIDGLDVGKVLPGAHYVHRCAAEFIPSDLWKLVGRVVKALKIDDSKWHIVKFSKVDFKFSLLSYPTFFDEPYPPLTFSWTIDLSKLSVRETDYSNSANPPILHRRETFVQEDHPQRDFFSEFTREGEVIGLYENARTIGLKESWLRLIKRKGYRLDEQGRLQPLELKNDSSSKGSTTGLTIERHKTALSRDKLSLPFYLLSKAGLLDGKYSVLDYGCGKGDDVRELLAHDLDCIGWDPAFQPDVEPIKSEIVNLGYVINVIEDKEERLVTLKKAYELAERLLLVSAMLGTEEIFEKFKPFKDGVVTKRNTFQKYYMQAELRQYLETSLENSAIAISPGIFAVFKDKELEQTYLLNRQLAKRQWTQLTARPVKIETKKQQKSIFEKHDSLMLDFWNTCLELGRLPLREEVEFHENISYLCGSLNKGFQLCKSHYGDEELKKAVVQKKNDLLVHFALGYFNQRRDVYSRMPLTLQADIKYFFGSYTMAREEGRNLLYSVSDVDLIYDACVAAHKLLPASELNGQHDLIFHKDFLWMCPIELRTYIGCASQLYGDIEEVNLIKAHIQSGKVSLLVYDDWSKDIPLLKERIKIKLRNQDIDFYDYYGPYEPQPLKNKNDFIL